MFLIYYLYICYYWWLVYSIFIILFEVDIIVFGSLFIAYESLINTLTMSFSFYNNLFWKFYISDW